MRSTLPRLLPAALLGVLGLACTPGDDYLPLDASKATLTANRHLSTHLKDGARTVAILGDSRRLDEVVNGREPAPCPDDVFCSTNGHSDTFDYDEAADALAAWLAEHVFHAGNVESTTPDSVTYRLRPEVICADDDEDGAGEPDEDCVRVLTEVPVRFTVRSQVQDDLEIALQVGSHRVADLELFAAHMAATIDLAATRSALDAIAAVLEEDAIPLPPTFAGRLRGAVIRETADRYTVAFSVVETLAIAFDDQNDPGFFDVAVAPSEALRVTFDTVARTVSSKVDVAAVDVKVALELLAGGDDEVCEWVYDDALGYDEWVCTSSDREPYEGVIAVRLGGINGEGSFDVSQDVVELTGLGLGDETSTVRFNDELVLSLDVNAYAGRRFDLRAEDVSGGVDVTVSPSLAVGLFHDLTPLVAQLEDIPGWLLGGSSHVAVDEADAPKLRLLDGSDSEEDDSDALVKVVAGRLALTASQLDEPILVEAPACLVPSEDSLEDDAGDEVVHPFSSFAAGSCE